MLLGDFKEKLLSYMGLEKYITSEKEWVKLKNELIEIDCLD
jgi:hypothetical protein